MARKHLSGKQIGAALGTLTANEEGQYTQVWRAWDQAFDKVVRVFNVYPHEILLMLAEGAKERRSMQEDEIQLRVAMLEGRANRTSHTRS